MTRSERTTAFYRTGIYPVLTPDFTCKRPLPRILEELGKAGAKTVQLRMKKECDREIMDTAVEFREICDRYSMLLIINDRIDIALGSKADGVHLGQNDIPPLAARRIAGDLLIGVSCHSIGQALEATGNGADYVNLGPIFATATKTNTSAPLGTDIIARAADMLDVPFTVMGGIKEDKLPELVRLGAKHIAMVTEISEAADVRQKFRRLSQILT